MIKNFMDVIITDLFPRIFNFFDSCMLADGVSLISVLVAAILIFVFIHALLMRV